VHIFPQSENSDKREVLENRKKSDKEHKMDISDMYAVGDIAANSDEHAIMVISAGWYIDTIAGNLNNLDLLRVIGRALILGYRDFSVNLYKTDTLVLNMDKGVLTVNWDIVRKATQAEWNALNNAEIA
jgi:hypothetical protein